MDVLVNNAGIGPAVPALKESPEEFRRVLDVNLSGRYWMAQRAAAVMEPARLHDHLSGAPRRGPLRDS